MKYCTKRLRWFFETVKFFYIIVYFIILSGSCKMNFWKTTKHLWSPKSTITKYRFWAKTEKLNFSPPHWIRLNEFCFVILFFENVSRFIASDVCTSYCTLLRTSSGPTFILKISRSYLCFSRKTLHSFQRVKENILSIVVFFFYFIVSIIWCFIF